MKTHEQQATCNMQVALDNGQLTTDNSERKGGTDKRCLLVREINGRERGTTDKLRLSVPPVRLQTTVNAEQEREERK